MCLITREVIGALAGSVMVVDVPAANAIETAIGVVEALVDSDGYLMFFRGNQINMNDENLGQ